jgi:hypothetical protein
MLMLPQWDHVDLGLFLPPSLNFIVTLLLGFVLVLFSLAQVKPSLGHELRFKLLACLISVDQAPTLVNAPDDEIQGQSQ